MANASVNLRGDARELFDISIASVTPQTMVSSTLRVKEDTLVVEDMCYILNRNVHVIAFGKAVIGMVKAVEDTLGSHVVDGIASVPCGIQAELKSSGKWDFLPCALSKIKIIEGASNNIPDENSHEASHLIIDLLKRCNKDDIVLVLISGGGSALLPSPIPPVTIQELSVITQILSKRGASIQQLNILRKHLELLKGGGLAEIAYPSKVISLILSDVIDNDVNFIASGPTATDCSTAQQCIDLLETFSLLDDVPSSILSVLKKEYDSRGDRECDESRETLRFHCQNVQNVIIGSNVIALDSTIKHAELLGYGTYLLSPSITGDAKDRGHMFAFIIDSVCRAMLTEQRLDALITDTQLSQFGLDRMQVADLLKAAINFHQWKKAICILAAGETTVTVTGKGLGGRNQHMVLSTALALEEQCQDVLKKFDIVFFSGGTDGQDGPTDAAGALCDADLIKRAKKLDLDPLAFLENNDSYNFFARVDEGKNHVKTGLTGTNVMDIQIILIASKT